MNYLFLALLLVGCTHKKHIPLKMYYTSEPKGALHELVVESKIAVTEENLANAAELFTFNTCHKKNRIPEIKDQKFTGGRLFRAYTCEVDSKEVVESYKKMIMKLCRNSSGHLDVESLCEKALPNAKAL